MKNENENEDVNSHNNNNNLPFDNKEDNRNEKENSFFNLPLWDIYFFLLTWMVKVSLLDERKSKRFSSNDQLKNGILFFQIKYYVFIVDTYYK